MFDDAIDSNLISGPLVGIGVSSVVVVQRLDFWIGNVYPREKS